MVGSLLGRGIDPLDSTRPVRSGRRHHAETKEPQPLGQGEFGDTNAPCSQRITLGAHCASDVSERITFPFGFTGCAFHLPLFGVELFAIGAEVVDG